MEKDWQYILKDSDSKLLIVATEAIYEKCKDYPGKVRFQLLLRGRWLDGVLCGICVVELSSFDEWFVFRKSTSVVISGIAIVLLLIISLHYTARWGWWSA